MQKNTSIILALIALFIGFGLGQYLDKDDAGKYANSSNDAGLMNQEVGGHSHMMPDGTMMSNDSDKMSMAQMMADMNAELRGKTGDDFDKAFLSEMIVHHQGAVEMADLALKNAKHQEIKDLAKAIISAQNKEISSMKSWQKSWYMTE